MDARQAVPHLLDAHFEIRKVDGHPGSDLPVCERKKIRGFADAGTGGDQIESAAEQCPGRLIVFLKSAFEIALAVALFERSKPSDAGLLLRNKFGTILLFHIAAPMFACPSARPRLQRTRR